VGGLPGCAILRLPGEHALRLPADSLSLLPACFRRAGNPPRRGGHSRGGAGGPGARPPVPRPPSVQVFRPQRRLVFLRQAENLERDSGVAALSPGGRNVSLAHRACAAGLEVRQHLHSAPAPLLCQLCALGRPEPLPALVDSLYTDRARPERFEELPPPDLRRDLPRAPESHSALRG